MKFYNLITTLGFKIIKLRYKNSIFGFMWSMMNPLMYLAIFSFVFSYAFVGIDRYPLYALSGLIFWTFFSTTTIQVIESVINSSGVLKSLNVPTISFPLSALFASVINLGISMIPFGVLMLLFGLQIGWETLLFFPILIIYSAFVFGVSIFLCALNVYFRDVQLAWTSFLPAIFYSTPIAFTSSLIPEKFQWILQLNPLYHYVTCIRKILYYNEVPSWNEFGFILGGAIISLSIGLFVFNRLERGFVSQY